MVIIIGKLMDLQVPQTSGAALARAHRVRSRQRPPHLGGFHRCLGGATPRLIGTGRQVPYLRPAIPVFLVVPRVVCMWKCRLDLITLCGKTCSQVCVTSSRMSHTLTWVVHPTVLYGVEYIGLVSLESCALCFVWCWIYLGSRGGYLGLRF